MIKQTLIYKDYSGEEHTEDYYFHLSKPELVDLEVSREGGLSVWLPQMISSNDLAAVVEMFKKIVSMSLGIRSEDGRKFDKRSPEARAYVREFMDSPAYEALFDAMTQNENAAAAFITGIVPSGLLSANEIASLKSGTPPPAAPAELPWARREPTSKELREMTRDQLLDVYARKNRPPQAAAEQ